jgi:hypothetical protein
LGELLHFYTHTQTLLYEYGVYWKTHVNAGLCNISGNFKGDITAAGNNVILLLVLNRYHT